MSVIALPKAAAANLRELGRLQDIPLVRQLGMLALVAVTIALGLWLFTWSQKPDFVPVHAGLDAKSTAEASELLRSARIPFRLDPATGALAVPVDQAGEARMALASAGLPASPGGGFETIHGDQGFGTSQFIESARYQHAMEVELARTIANLRPVREARVHLAMPKPSAFTRQREPASASVVLQLRAGSTLEQGQVNAIVHLVASSIPGLPAENVTVVDQFGRMLSNADPHSDDAVGARQFEQQRRQEAVYVQRIQELLEPMTGPGRVSATVSVDMDFAQTEEASERYGPQPAIVRSEQISESGILGAEPVARGVPGSASNTPEAAEAEAAAEPAASSAAATGPGSRSAVRNYEIDRTLTHTRQAPGRIRRVTAAVLVDHIAPPAAGAGGTAAQAQGRPLSEAELARIETLVQQAIGFDAARGDVVSVVNAPFARDTGEAPDESIPFWEHPRAREFGRIIFGGLAVLVLILAVLRPASRQLLGARTATATVIPAGELDEDPTVSLSAPAQVQAAKDDGPAPTAAMSFDEKLEIARTAVSTDPRRVAQVVRDMVASDG
jgi:flagellar M-ring protein FliF